jgi:muramoyltetrapeptide carboxypeptidase
LQLKEKYFLLKFVARKSGGHILLLEEMEAPMPREERSLRQLSILGVFNEITGLIVSKPEVFDPGEARFSYDDLIREIIGIPPYPVVTNFDCGHTVPMITIPLGAKVELQAEDSGKVTFRFL